MCLKEVINSSICVYDKTVKLIVKRWFSNMWILVSDLTNFFSRLCVE